MNFQPPVFMLQQAREYCEVISNGILSQPDVPSIHVVREVAELAERLRWVTVVGPTTSDWIDRMRQVLDYREVHTNLFSVRFLPAKLHIKGIPVQY